MTTSEQKPFLVIYNEQSGPAFGDHKKIIRDFLQKHEVSFVFHSIGVDGSLYIHNPNDFARIIISGGDGTLKEVANWVIKNNAITPIALLPRGSGNMIARSYKIPRSIDDALMNALFGIPLAIPTGVINKREYFLLAVSSGVDVNILRHTTRRLKRMFGIIAYVLGFFRALINLYPSKFFIKSEEFEGTVMAHSVFITPLNSFMNNTIGTPEERELLKVAILKSRTLFEYVHDMTLMLLGKLEKNSRYTFFTTKEVYVLPLKIKRTMQIDGELVHLSYLDVTMSPHSIILITPQS